MNRRHVLFGFLAALVPTPGRARDIADARDFAEAVAIRKRVEKLFKEARWNRTQGPADPWYGQQKIPGTGDSCCSLHDGVEAEEQIRGDEIWTRFVTRDNVKVDWMPVPPGAILPQNHNGAPVVWYGVNSADDDDEGETYAPGYFIRCFARGTRV